MHTFLGVPILLHGEAWGNLYLTEKAAGEFTDDDEQVVTVLADWAAIAIANSRLYRDVQQRNDDLQRANRGLETTTEISLALGGVTDLERVLELIAKRSRALIDARATELALLEGDKLVIAAAAGEGVEGVQGMRLSIEESVVAEALRTGRAQRLREVPEKAFANRVLQAHNALVVPMVFRNRPIGYLCALDRLGSERFFTEEDERLLQAFAASAATAVTTAQVAGAEAVRRSMRASEEERGRWARELHDETLQELAGLKVLLGGARRSDDPARLHAAIDQAVELIAGGIANLRSLIADLRPAALDELGTQPAVESLVARVAATTGLDIELDVSLAYGQGLSDERHTPEVEVAIYRLVQEGLTNVVKHANADEVRVRIAEEQDEVVVEVRDDGRGFDTGQASDGFGLVGMRERVELVRGTLDLQSGPGEGTTVLARIPVVRRDTGATKRGAGDPAPLAVRDGSVATGSG